MQFHIDPVTCDGCVRRVTQAIQSVDPMAQVRTDPAAHKLDVTSGHPRGEIEAVLASAGYAAAQAA